MTNNVLRVSVHFGYCCRYCQKGTICRAAILVNLQVIRLKRMSFDAGDAGRRFRHDLLSLSIVLSSLNTVMPQLTIPLMTPSTPYRRP